MNRILIIAKKELQTYFSQPAGYIFIGAFLFIVLFIFFWVETFFARNIADVRPLFEWMPVLMIFLVAALTMKMWSEERRMGTLEFLLTSPIKTHELVIGKFLACMGLVGICLLLTLGVPVTVSLLGSLDWGPVIAAYLASFLMAGAYVAIGLMVSSRTDNQIVSLIISSLVCGFFYLIGSDALGAFFGNRPAEILKLIGTGSRFESVGRGVIDFRDIYYYLSLIGVFIVLNIYSLEVLRWTKGIRHSWQKQFRFVLALLIANFVIANFWLGNIRGVRGDFTRGNFYSLSESTKHLISELQEPLLIRGYFSDKTHPLLAPLVPEIRDMLKEYRSVSGGHLRVEFIDPREDEEIEAEANQKYGIKPIPFQFADRYRAEVVNSYFDLLIAYGDRYEVLSFRDIIDVKPKGETDVEVRLRNLEYDITRSIKKVLFGFQNLDHLFSGIKEPIHFIGYLSEKNLPEVLEGFRDTLDQVLTEYRGMAGDKLTVEYKDPSADPALAEEIASSYGFQPMATDFLARNTFYFYMTLQDQKKVVPIQLPEDLEGEALKKNFEAVFKRFAPGFLKTIGMVTPVPPLSANPMMQQMQQGKTFDMLSEKLEQNYEVLPLDLKNGVVDDEIDILLVIHPENFGDKELYALDQFLMKGGTVIVATAPFSVALSHTGMRAEPVQSGIEEWLKHYGVVIKQEMIMDEQNVNFPVAVNRNLGGFRVQEIKMINYPYSIDIRGEGLNEKSGLVAGIPQATMNWASPIEVDAEKIKQRRLIEILKTSSRSWLTKTPDILPDFSGENPSGFEKGELTGPYVVGMIMEGSFDSFFKGKEAPLAPEAEGENGDKEEGSLIVGKIDKSPESSRLIFYSSNDFLADDTLQLSRANGSSQFLNNLQLVENTVDWSVEDRALLGLRGRSHDSRTLKPITESRQMFWEYLNYALALIGLLAVYLVHRQMQKRFRMRYHDIGVV